MKNVIISLSLVGLVLSLTDIAQAGIFDEVRKIIRDTRGILRDTKDTVNELPKGSRNNNPNSNNQQQYPNQNQNQQIMYPGPGTSNQPNQPTQTDTQTIDFNQGIPQTNTAPYTPPPTPPTQYIQEQPQSQTQYQPVVYPGPGREVPNVGSSSSSQVSAETCKKLLALSKEQVRNLDANASKVYVTCLTK